MLNAIHNADAQTAASLPTNPIRLTTYCSRTITPEPRYLPRQVLHPTPRYLPRPVLHPSSAGRAIAASTAVPEGESFRTSPPARRRRGKSCPGRNRRRPPNVIKMIVRPPDMLTKGMLIDLFI